MPVHPVPAAVLASWQLSGWQKLMGRAPTPDDLIVPGRTGGPRCAGWALKCWYADMKILGLHGRHTRPLDAVPHPVGFGWSSCLSEHGCRAPPRHRTPKAVHGPGRRQKAGEELEKGLTLPWSDR